MSPRASIIALAFGVLLLGQDGPAAAESGHHLGVQGGWFSLELDYESPQGIYADLGCPWIFLAFSSDVAPTHLRVGYSFSEGDGWRVRFGLRSIFLFSADGDLGPWGGSSEDDDDGHVAWMVGPEVDFGFAFSSGITLGLQFPLFMFTGSENSSSDLLLFGPASLSIIQVYVGYRWGL